MSDHPNAAADLVVDWRQDVDGPGFWATVNGKAWRLYRRPGLGDGAVVWMVKADGGRWFDLTVNATPQQAQALATTHIGLRLALQRLAIADQVGQAIEAAGGPQLPRPVLVRVVDLLAAKGIVQTGVAS